MMVCRPTDALASRMNFESDDPIHPLRAQLAREIVRALGGSFAQHFLSKRYGIRQPRMSELCRGQVQRCSMEWLIRRVYRMGGRVALTIELEDIETQQRRRAIERRVRRQPGGLRE